MRRRHALPPAPSTASRSALSTASAWVAAIAAATMIAAPHAAFAGGQYAGDNGSLGTQRAGAFTARADDASALFYNPAALFKVGTRRQVVLGVNVVSFEQSFRRDGRYSADGDGSKADYAGDAYPLVEHQGPVQPVPSIAAAFSAGKLAIGVGVFAPHGYGKRNYPEQVRTASGNMAPAPQRYDIVSQEGVIAFPSVGASYQLSPIVSVGARASYGYARLASRQFAQGLPNNAETPDRDTDATITVADNSVITWGAGLHIHPSPTWEIGASYNAPIRIDAVGSSAVVLGDTLRNINPGQETVIQPLPDNMTRCATGGSVGAIATCVDMVLPQTATIGVRWIARDQAGRELGDIEIDVRWENWKAADSMRVTMDGRNSAVDSPVNPTSVRRGLEDVYSVRLGGSTRLGRDRATSASFGVGYETAAAPVSWTRLNNDVSERFTAAAGFSFDLGTMRLDLGASIVDPADRTVYDYPVADQGDMGQRVQPDVTAPLSAPDEQPYHPFNAGQYRARYLIASVGLAATW